MRTFGLQLQNLDLQQARQSGFDLLITDYSRTGRAEGRLSRREVQSLQAGGKRLVVAYLSLGEAEDYRYYWQSGWRPGRPGWLGATNPNWGGNYKVKYWSPGWKKVVFDYLDQLIATGYDGVFLDVVDAYEYWEPRGVPDARRRMAELVKALSARAGRQAGSDFGIFLNGGEGLVDLPGVLPAITGVAKEEMFFGLSGDGKPTHPRFRTYVQKRLQAVVRAGKLVLSIDYTQNPAQVRSAHQQARRAGYLEYVGPRALDRLQPQSK